MTDPQEQSLTPSPPPRIGPLNTIGRVREEMAKLYKAARKGTLSTGDASRLAFILVSLAKLIEGESLEARIERLEAASKAAERNNV